MDPEWLIKLMTLEEVEAENRVVNESLGPAPVVFGFQNPEWTALVAQMQTGDEFWKFASPAETWKHMCGRAGIALIRQGKLIDMIVTLMN